MTDPFLNGILQVVQSSYLDKLIKDAERVYPLDDECPNCGGTGYVARAMNPSETACCDECKGTGHDTRRDA